MTCRSPARGAQSLNDVTSKLETVTIKIEETEENRYERAAPH